MSLTNTGGIARLLDPFGNTISMAKQYGKAKDNQSWALANNEWYWTARPTPGEANIIEGGVAGRGSSNSSPGTAGNVTTSSGQGGSAGNVLGSSQLLNPNQAEVAKLHPSALASVAMLGVAYGAYEYKQDLANRYRKFRSNRAASRALSGKP